MSLETMTKLATTTVGVGGVAAVDFLNIPQGYTDLRVVCSTRTSNSNIFGFSYIYFNGSQVSYSQRVIEGTGAGVSSYTQASTYGLNDDSVGNTSTSSTFSNGELYIPNYSASSFKSFSFDTVGENNATTAYSQLIAGLWSNPSPITRITFSTSATSLSGGTPLYMQNSTFTLYGIKNARQTAGNSIKATGGNIVFDGTYVYHVFPTSGTFTPTQPLVADYLVVAGGGGGGNAFSNGSDGAGGGGAGGLRSTVDSTGGGGTLGSVLSLSPQAYAVTVGAGGAGGTTDNRGSSGSNSAFSTITSTGGGGGGGIAAGQQTGGDGGSGGGASCFAVAGGAASPSGQGYAGGTGATNGSAGGGGAGGVGVNGVTSSINGGNGGVGVLISAIANATGTGVNGYYAGGGGGGADATGGTAGSGGAGGGGTGFTPTTTAAVAGTANTGGGGGGGGAPDAYAVGGSGGSGIVIVRYKG